MKKKKTDRGARASLATLLDPQMFCSNEVTSLMAVSRARAWCGLERLQGLVSGGVVHLGPPLVYLNDVTSLMAVSRARASCGLERLQGLVSGGGVQL